MRAKLTEFANSGRAAAGLAALLAAYGVAVVGGAYRRGARARGAEHWAPAPPPERWPSVTLLVPAWNERGTLEILMRSLRDLDYPQWEAIVVAGGPDGSYEAARAAVGDPRISVIEQGPRGKNGALNDGLRLARGEVIVILDADAQISPPWLRALTAPLAGAADATTGNYLPLRSTPFSLHGQMEKISVYAVRGQVFLQGSGGIALRREALAALGGFPEHVRVGVDWDLDARVAMAGLRRAYCPEAILYTERPATLREWWKNELRWRRAHLASLVRLREHFLADPRSALLSLHPYVVAWFCAAITLLTFGIVALGPRGARRPALLAWGAVLGQTGISRAGLSFEVAAFTGDARWLKLAWTPPLLWAFTLAASLVACLRPGPQSAHFKGPRHMIDRAPATHDR